MNTPRGIAVLGATGRMGRAVLGALAEFPDLTLAGATASATSPWLGQDATLLAGSIPRGIQVALEAHDAVRGAAVAIDFTLPQAADANLRACLASGAALVIGTTGHSTGQREVIDAAARQIPVVLAPNMSLGVNLLLKLAGMAAAALNQDYDIEIFEAHHRNKKDAPSGTALRIGEVVAKARGTTLAASGEFERHGETGARKRGAIGFSVLRGGDIVGDHTLTFAGPGERIELTHRAHDRSGFARGALTAARWVIGKPPGLYSMQDVLGLGAEH